MSTPIKGIISFKTLRFGLQRLPKGSPTLRCHWVHISSQVASDLDADNPANSAAAIPDAKFEVIGSPFSLLSVSLSASQNLYTRRGTLAAIGGKVENAVSTLSILEPFARAPLRIPFLYQRISSITPVTALISTKSSATSVTVVRLDGSVDWMVAGQALLAWTGQTLSITPSINWRMNLAYWGSSGVTGRGLLALAGQGSISQIVLKEGESYVVHPSNIVAYTVNRDLPLPYRLRSSSFRMQVPSVTSIIPDTKIARMVRESPAWRILGTLVFKIWTWSKTAIWGDRLFLQFSGPMTILLQSRPFRTSDILTSRAIEENADSPPGTAQIPGSASLKDAPKQPSTESKVVESGNVQPTN